MLVNYFIETLQRLRNVNAIINVMKYINSKDRKEMCFIIMTLQSMNLEGTLLQDFITNITISNYLYKSMVFS